MPRILIILVAVTVLAAAAALGFAVYRSLHPAETPPVVAVAPPVETAPAETVEVPAPALKVEVAPPVAGDQSVQPLRPQQEAIPPANPTEARAALVTDMVRTKKNLRYRLPSSLMAQRLAAANDPTLRLNADQIRQISEIDASMKGLIDEHLQPIWATRDLLLVQMRTFAKQGQTENLAAARNHYNELYAKETAFRLEVNQQYVSKLSGILTDDQMAYFSGAMTPEMQTRLYGASIEETGESYTNSKTTDPVEVRLREHETRGVDVNLP